MPGIMLVQETTAVATRGHRAPETSISKRVSTAGNVFSLGMVIAVKLLGKSLPNMGTIVHQPAQPRSWAKWAQGLIEACLCKHVSVNRFATAFLKQVYMSTTKHQLI